MINYSRHNDQQLIALLKEGDHHAYTEFYERYFQLLFVYAYKRLRNQDEAKDVVQDFFTVMWLKADKLNFTTAVSAYCFRAINNRIVDIFLHKQVATRFIGTISISTERGEESTDHLIRERQLMFYIEKEIQALPVKMRRVFELSRKSNYTYKEIADELSISEKTVHRQISNALIRLRAKLSLFAFLIIITKF